MLLLDGTQDNGHRTTADREALAFGHSSFLVHYSYSLFSFRLGSEERNCHLSSVNSHLSSESAMGKSASADKLEDRRIDSQP